jgi:hypothetical protein
MIPAVSVVARLRPLPLAAHAWATVALLGAAIALVFFYAPLDADQGLTQKIFYIHVPIALTAYACFAWGAWKALVHLRTRAPGADLESYSAIHQGLIFGALTLSSSRSSSCSSSTRRISCCATPSSRGRPGRTCAPSTRFSVWC